MTQRAAIALSAAQEAELTLNPQSKIAKLDIAVAELRALAAYEDKGIKTPVESAKLRLDRLSAERDALILKTARDEAVAVLGSLAALDRAGEKIARLDRFKIKLSEYRRRCGDGRSIEILEKRVRTASYRIRLSARLEEAEAAESDGKPADANRLLREALEILTKEGRGDPSFRGQKERIEKRLAASSPTPSK